MPLSFYAFDFPHPSDPGAVILFSARTTAQVVVDRATLVALQNNEAVAGCEPLYDCGLLVANPQQEQRQALNYVGEVNQANRHLLVSVIVGMACNFACSYCYEGERKGNHAMAAETIQRLTPFLMELCKPQYDRVSLSFYGGEPLLYPEIIKQISVDMAAVCQQRGLDYSFGLISNGFLLTPERVRELQPYGLSAAQITLDGPASSHNKSRPLKNGGPSFATIVENIKACAGLIKINLGGNYSRENYQRFPELFAELRAAGLGPAQLGSLVFSPVLAPEEKKGPMAVHGGCSSCSEPWLAPAVVALRADLMANGYAQKPIEPALCMVERDNAFTVHYDGNLYQCPAMVGHEELVCGDIWTGFRDYRSQYQRGHWQEEVKCQGCKYVHLCFGGCRFMTLGEGGRMGIDCKKEFYDATLAAMVQQDVLAQEGKG